MKTLFVILTLSLSLNVFSQNGRYLSPTTYKLNFNEADEKTFNDNMKRSKSLMKKLGKKMSFDDLSEADQKLLRNFGETVTNYWNILDGGCSWYCGGGPEKVTASSFLAPQGKATFDPENAHDLNYKNAWAEGVPGNGVGEYLEYHFSPASPRITTIMVVNGYVKTEEDWENNGRVKSLNMYLNDTLYAILKLKDMRAEQRFSVPAIGYPDRKNLAEIKDNENWTLKFEIASVYPGKKYDDVVLSEIFFHGIDVHCLAAGTQIQMADGSHQNIEDLKTGDAISSFNEAAQRFEPATILELASPIHQDLVEITFADGTSLTCTQDHPMQAADGTWKSLNPEKTAHDYNYEEVKRLEEGDLMMVKGKRAGKTIESIRELKGLQQTYTIVKLDKNQSFVANGIVVGTEELRQPVVSIRHK